MHNERSHERAAALPPVEDEDLASRSSVRLLISGASEQAVELLARRIHGSGPRGQSYFVRTRAAEFPIRAKALRDFCLQVLAAADGGSVLISAVEEMPAQVQRTFMPLLQRLESAPGASAAVRLMAGTTVPLLERVTAGTFSTRLFYRLNIIHLDIGGAGSYIGDHAKPVSSHEPNDARSDVSPGPRR
jgi:DNA-binding NtrC family response regulator